jgi:type IV pilus assembly protein PilV
MAHLPHRSSGFSLIEVLVTIVILLIGLLGLIGLQGRALSAQMESYQRAQALILAQDMVDRINANRKNAASYITTTPLGTGGSCPIGTTTTDTDLCAWNNALQGAAETIGTSTVGAMIGARGCVFQQVAPGPGVAAIYQVVVAWQGISSTAAPDASTAYSAGQCGFNQYKDKNGTVQENLHRTINLPVAIANLQ